MGLIQSFFGKGGLVDSVEGLVLTKVKTTINRLKKVNAAEA